MTPAQESDRKSHHKSWPGQQHHLTACLGTRRHAMRTASCCNIFLAACAHIDISLSVTDPGVCLHALMSLLLTPNTALKNRLQTSCPAASMDPCWTFRSGTWCVTSLFLSSGLVNAKKRRCSSARVGTRIWDACSGSAKRDLHCDRQQLMTLDFNRML